VLILATAAESDAIDPIWWMVAWWCFIPAGVASLVALVTLIFSRTTHGAFRPLRLVVVSILLSLFPICFAAYIHHIDFVEIAIDGTPASKPLWKALMFVSLPVITSLVALVVSRTGQRNNQEGEQGGDGDAEEAV